MILKMWLLIRKDGNFILNRILVDSPNQSDKAIKQIDSPNQTFNPIRLGRGSN